MHHSYFESLRSFIADYGYWAVALALLCESAGVPVPGEITLLLASFLAFSEHHLHLGWIIVVGIIAASLGGVLRMRWQVFALFNFLGAAAWVIFIAGIGYLFGQHWRRLMNVMQRFNIAVAILAALGILYLWWRYRHQPSPDRPRRTTGE